MASTTDHIAARSDTDLIHRLVASAEMQGIPNAQHWVETNRGAIIAAQIDGGTTIADIHAYAVATYVPTPRPGQNPAAVTDAQLSQAVSAVAVE